MAKTQTAPRPPSKAAEPRPDEPQDFVVTAARNLGATITGGARLRAGQKGTVTMTAERHARLKKAGLFA